MRQNTQTDVTTLMTTRIHDTLLYTSQRLLPHLVLSDNVVLLMQYSHFHFFSSSICGYNAWQAMMVDILCVAGRSCARLRCPCANRQKNRMILGQCRFELLR